MDIKNNTANIVSISRVFVAFAAIGLLFVHTTEAYIWALVLTIIAFTMDGVDGYIARKYNQSSELGSVLDIMGDRIVEASYWIVFAVLGWLNIIFPLICVARAFTTDSIRSVALSKGMTAFGDKSMQSTSWGKFICASKFMRISYAVAKVAAFVLKYSSLKRRASIPCYECCCCISLDCDNFLCGESCSCCFGERKAI